MKSRNSLLRLPLVVFILAAPCLIICYLWLVRPTPKPAKIIEEISGRERRHQNEEVRLDKGNSRRNAQTSYSESLDNELTRYVEIHHPASRKYPIRNERIISELPGGGSVIKSESSYVASHVFIGLEGDEVPGEFLKLGQVKPLYPESGLGHYLLTMDDWHIDSVPEILALLAQEPYAGYLRFAEPDWVVGTMVLPNDPEVQNGNQWALRTQLSGAHLNADAGWEIRSGAEDVIVAIIDSGINLTHQDLVENLWVNPDEIASNGLDDDGNGVVDDVYGYNAITEDGNVSDDNGHGTHVAGVVGAVGNNGLGISGVAWNTNLMAVKVLNEAGQGQVSDITQGVIYAVNKGADIINASFGSYNFLTPIYDIFHYAEEHNVLVVAAAGNDASNNDEHPVYPASYGWDNIVTVGSLDQTGELSEFSNFGKNSVDVSAPGGDILSTFILGNDSYDRLSGTSMAAPQIAGILALLVQQFPGEPYSRQIDRLILGGADLKSIQGKMGYAIVPDLEKSLSIFNPPSSLRFTSRLENSIVRFPGQTLQLEVEVEDDADVQFSWSKEGATIPNATSNRLELSALSANSTGTYSVMAKKQGLQISDSINLGMLIPNLGLKSAADSNLPLGTVGNHPWLQTAEASVVGSTSIFSSPVNNNSSTSVFSYIEGPGQLTFQWKVSSEAKFDFLQLLVNGGVIRSISGDSGWRTVNIRFADLPLRILEWRYIKDGNKTEGLDRGYLDNILWISGSGDFPYISKQPESSTVSPGDSVSLIVEAEGGDLNYQWFKAGLELPSANQSSLTLTHALEGDSGVYHVEVYNQFGSVRSNPAEVKVGIFPVEIINHPSDLNVIEGLPVQFTVSVSGTSPFQYQWFKENQPIAGATEPVFEIENTVIGDSGSYHVLISNTASPEGVQSDSAVLSVQKRQFGPAIVKQSYNITVPEGQSAELYVAANGTGPLTYQWYFNGEAIADATQSVLLVENVSQQSTGSYYCAVSNLVGEIQSALMFISLRGNLGEALEQPLLTWDTNNEANVRQQSLLSHDGQDAMAIFADPENSLTWVRTWVEGPAEISYWYTMDGTLTPLSGRLFVLVDGVVLEELFNPEEFLQHVFVIEEPGLHEVRWSYVSNSLPLHAFLDELSVTPLNIIRNDPLFLTREIGGSFALELDLLSREPYAIEWFKDGQILSGKAGTEFFLPKVSLGDSGVYQAKLVNELGSFWSAEFELLVLSESVASALDTSGLEFEFIPDLKWIPQSEEVRVGSSALRTPPGDFARISTTVQGPRSGSFFSKNLQFNLFSSYSVSTEEVGDGWTKTTFNLIDESTYDLVWIKTGNEPGYLDGLTIDRKTFSISNSSYRTELNSPFQDSLLRVQVQGADNETYQWYKDGIKIPGATMEYHIVYYEQITNVSNFYVIVTSNGESKRSDTMTISKGVPDPAEGTFYEADGLILGTTQGEWKLTNLEPSASGGISFHPGTISAGEKVSRTLWTSVSGPGEISFKLKMGDGSGRLILGDSSEHAQRFYSSEAWQIVTYQVRGPYRYNIDFTYFSTGDEDFTEIPVFIDDLRYRQLPVSKLALADQYVSLGTPMYLQGTPLWEGAYSADWFKDGVPIAEFSGEDALFIDPVSEEHAGVYSLKLTNASGDSTEEFFNVVPQQNRFTEALDSEGLFWNVSNPLDWNIIVDQNATGGKLIGTSLQRFSTLDFQDPPLIPSIWIEPLVSGPGKLTLRYRFSKDADGSRLRVFKEEYLNEERNGYSEEWRSITSVIAEPGPVGVRYIFDAYPQFQNTPRILLIDSLTFEPFEQSFEAPPSQIRNVGGSVEFKVEGSLTAAPFYDFKWLLDEMEKPSSVPGILRINGLREADFGTYLLRIENDFGGISDFPFQLINGSVLNQGFKNPHVAFIGEGDSLLTAVTEAHSGRENVLRLSPGTPNEETNVEIYLEGPLTIQFDYKNLILNADQTGGSFRVNGEEIELLASQDWKTVQHEMPEPGTVHVRWNLRRSEAADGEGWLFDNLVIKQRAVIHSQLTGRTLLSGSPILLSADVSTGPNSTSRWYQDGELIPDIEGSHLYVSNPGYASTGEYFLQVDNEYGSVTSNKVQVLFQDNIPNEFPPQSWNRFIRNRENVGFNLNGGIDGGPALFFQATGNSPTRPGIAFSLLGPRKIEFLASAPGAAANEFVTSPTPAVAASPVALSAGWAKHTFELEQLLPYNVRLDFVSRIPTLATEYDDTTGWMDKIKVSWIEGHPFTDWIKKYFPERYATMTDFELLFGDEDDDGMYNYLEFGTLSSPKADSTNIKIGYQLIPKSGGGGGGGVFTPFFASPSNVIYERKLVVSFDTPAFQGPQFAFDLELSYDLKTWRKLPHTKDLLSISDKYEIQKLIVDEDDIDPTRPLFLRLIVTSELYGQLN